jgi:hypothetical protein
MTLTNQQIKNIMNKTEYKAQASFQRKQAIASDVVERTLARNVRRDYRCLVAPALRKLAKQIRRECETLLIPARANEDALMAL